MVSKRVIATIVLSAIMLVSAGCTGWGDDGPSDPPEEETDGNGEAQEDVDPSDSDEGGVDADEPPESDENDVEDAEEDSSEDDSDESDEMDDSNESDETDADGDENNESDETDENSDNGQEDPEVYSLSVEADSEVTLERNWENASTTREPTNGVVEFSVIEGEYTLSADGYEDMGVEVGDDMTVEMSEVEETHTLTVETQQDVPVTLERLSDGATTERAASDGTVEFTVSEGYYGLSADGHYDIHEEFAVHVEEDTTITLQSTDGERIEVTVVDAETGEPIPGAEISGICNWWYTSGDAHIMGETNSDGVAQPETITPTSCDSGVSAEGYEDKSVPLSVPDDDGIVIELEPEEQTTHTLHITTLDENGDVYDNQVDYGIEGVILTDVARTGQESFALENGEYDVVISPSSADYQDHTTTVVIDGADEELVIELEQVTVASLVRF